MGKLKFELSKYFTKNRNSKKSLYLDVMIMFLISLTLFFYILKTYTLSPQTEKIIYFIDEFILVIFVFEFFIRFWLEKSKMDFIKSKFTWLDAIAIFPTFLGFGHLHFLKILRIFRFFRYMSKYLTLSHIHYDKITIERIFLGRIIFTLFTILFISSSVIYEVENIENPKINNFHNSLYLTIMTVTTVGYGDVVPITELGKFSIMVIIISGILLLPWQVGILVRYMTHHKTQNEKTCNTCGLKTHDIDSRFCKHCGSKIFKKIGKKESEEDYFKNF